MSDPMAFFKTPRNLLIVGGVLAVIGIAGVAAMTMGSGHKAPSNEVAMAASGFGANDTKSTKSAPNVKTDYHPANDPNASAPRNLETKNTGGANNVALNVKTTPNSKNAYVDGPLDVISYGAPTAPVTIIEYGSFTCPHCAEFHEVVLPKLKEKYFDKGTVRLIYRPFFRNAFDVDVGLFVACLPAERRKPWIAVLFHQQESWVPFGVADELTARKKTRDSLEAYSVQAGMKAGDFDKCLENTANKDWQQAIHDQGIKDGLEGTPYFLINGQKAGPMDVDAFVKLLDAAVAKAQGHG